MFNKMFTESVSSINTEINEASANSKKAFESSIEGRRTDWSGSRVGAMVINNLGNVTRPRDGKIEIKQDGKSYTMLYVVGKKVAVEYYADKAFMEAGHSANYEMSIPAYNKLVISINKSYYEQTINRIEGKPVTTISKIEVYDTNPANAYRDYGYIYFKNGAVTSLKTGAPAGIYTFGQHEMKITVDNEIDYLRNQGFSFSAGLEKSFKANWPNLFNDDTEVIKKALKKLKPISQDSDRSMIPSSAYVSGVQTVNQRVYNVKTLVKKYGETAVRDAARDVFIRNSHKDQIHIEKGYLTHVNTSSQWYD